MLDFGLDNNLHVPNSPILDIKNPNPLIPEGLPEDIPILEAHKEPATFLRGDVEHAPESRGGGGWPVDESLLLGGGQIELEGFGGVEVCQMLGEGLELFLLVRLLLAKHGG